MGLDELLHALRDRATREADAYRRAADAQVTTLRRRAETNRSERRSAALDALDETFARDASAELAAARTEARRQALEARQRLAARAFAVAGEYARGERAADLVKPVVTRWIEAALPYAGASPVTIRCRASLAPILEANVARDGASVVVDDSVDPGAVIEADDGRIVIDLTVPALLARRRPAAEIDLVKELDDHVARMG